VSSQTQILLQRTWFFLLYTIIFMMYFHGFIGIYSYIMSIYIIFCTSNTKQINAFVPFLTMIFWAYYIYFLIRNFNYVFSIFYKPKFVYTHLLFSTWVTNHRGGISGDFIYCNTVIL
jgi:hypothetical protein